jgi:hypothetical protein
MEIVGHIMEEERRTQEEANKRMANRRVVIGVKVHVSLVMRAVFYMMVREEVEVERRVLAIVEERQELDKRVATFKMRKAALKHRVVVNMPLESVALVL